MAAGTILVEAAARPALSEQRLETCAHKGAGHPDTLTDGACQAAAVALAGAYQQAFGAPMHFNVDKGLLAAGRSAPRFGGGKVLDPAKLLICGRAADPNGRFDVAQVVTQAARGYLVRTLHRGAGNIRVECEVRRGSRSLEAVYGGARRTANDTSFGVGFWRTRGSSAWCSRRPRCYARASCAPASRQRVTISRSWVCGATARSG